MFNKLLSAIQAGRGTGLNILLVGPAATGKTSAVRAAAERMGLSFAAQGTALEGFDLLGFTNGDRYVSTAFVDAYTNGGVILLDELDSYAPAALVALNIPLSSDLIYLPTGEMKRRHPDFVCVGAANTFGQGADHEYNTREKLDQSTLSRFAIKLPWGYDEEMELAVAAASGYSRKWVQHCQRVRTAAIKVGLGPIADLRTMIAGAHLLGAGFSAADVCEYTYRAALDTEQRKTLADALESA